MCPSNSSLLYNEIVHKYLDTRYTLLSYIILLSTLHNIHHVFLIVFYLSIKLHYRISRNMHQDFSKDFYFTFLYFCLSYMKKQASILLNTFVSYKYYNSLVVSLNHSLAPYIENSFEIFSLLLSNMHLLTIVRLDVFTFVIM